MKFDAPCIRGRPRLLSTIETLQQVFYVARTGCQWSNITPPRNVSYKTVFARFANWSKIGVFETAFSGLAKLAGDRASQRRSVLCTDTSYVKNIQGRGPTLGRNHTDRGRKATKVSVLTDDKGIPLHFCFHPANKNDCTLLRHLLDSASRCIGPLGRFQSLYADKGYDSQTCRTLCSLHGIDAQIPKRGQPEGWGTVRYVVERTFANLDLFRRIILRYDAKIVHFKSFHFLAGCYLVGK